MRPKKWLIPYIKCGVRNNCANHWIEIPKDKSERS